LLLPIFAAAILGGIGSPYGAMVGALLIGLAEELSTALIPTAYKPAVSLIILVLVLLVRPQGIFGKASR
jgi:branched-subunit amino acid ABC-type transport system permease component